MFYSYPRLMYILVLIFQGFFLPLSIFLTTHSYILTCMFIESSIYEVLGEHIHTWQQLACCSKMRCPQRLEKTRGLYASVAHLSICNHQLPVFTGLHAPSPSPYSNHLIMLNNFVRQHVLGETPGIILHTQRLKASTKTMGYFCPFFPFKGKLDRGLTFHFFYSFICRSLSKRE